MLLLTECQHVVLRERPLVVWVGGWAGRAGYKNHTSACDGRQAAAFASSVTKLQGSRVRRLGAIT